MPKYLSNVVCVDHPELEGLRWTGNRKCVKCDAERVKARMKERRKNPELRPVPNESQRKAKNQAAIRNRKKRYATDPAFREKERERCREAQRRRRAAAAEASVPTLDSYSASGV